MNSTNLPPLPAIAVSKPKVCELVQRYLAVWDDLTPEQKQAVTGHVDFCARCAAAQHLMSQATELLAHMPSSTPSPRVDRAIMAAIATQANGRRAKTPRSLLLGNKPFLPALVAAVLVLATLAGTYLMGSSMLSTPRQAFVLPANLSWTSYVLYQTESRLDKKGEHYYINSYYDMRNGQMHVETMQGDTLDVVAISDSHETLGMDEIHHVAQMGADEWMVDESMFSLSQLHRDMQAKRAVYLGTDEFKGQKVYRIRAANGLVLLLDMHYLPVNVLRGAVGSGTGEPVYDTLQLLSHAQVSESMWNMGVPTGFQMGRLPEKP